MARPFKCRCICSFPDVTAFEPCRRSNVQHETLEGIQLGIDEYEVIRLIDYRGFSQEECAVRMHVARTTVARMYDNARRKIAEALVLGKKLSITGGEVMVCERMRPECIGEPHCCHREKMERNETEDTP